MSVHKKINVAVIGATGYTGLDLILILSRHPKVKIVSLCATKNFICKSNKLERFRCSIFIFTKWRGSKINKKTL